MKHSVLVIDDFYNLEHALAKALPRYYLMGVPSGTAALHATKFRLFDLYIIDLVLSDTDGIKLTRDLRSLDYHAPIIVYSTVKEPMNVGNSWTAWHKHCDGLDELVALMQRLLRAHAVQN